MQNVATFSFAVVTVALVVNLIGYEAGGKKSLLGVGMVLWLISGGLMIARWTMI